MSAITHSVHLEVYDMFVEFWEFILISLEASTFVLATTHICNNIS